MFSNKPRRQRAREPESSEKPRPVTKHSKTLGNMCKNLKFKIEQTNWEYIEKKTQQINKQKKNRQKKNKTKKRTKTGKKNHFRVPSPREIDIHFEKTKKNTIKNKAKK